MRLLLTLAVLLAALLLAASAAPPTGAAPSGGITVRFLFDLGDGTYVWATETIVDPAAVNATWDAVQAAAQGAGIGLQWSWFSCCGVFITDMGNRSPPSGGVALFQWNRTTLLWEAASVGVSAMVLQDGDAVALSDNGFDPVTFANLYPVPTPLNPYPVQEFRADVSNTGDSGSSAPELFAVRWDRDLHLQEIPSSPAVAYGRVYVLTLDGLFALDEANGAVVWSNPAIRGLSSPAVFNGTLLLGGSDGRIHAIDAANGSELWNVTLIANPAFSGITSSPKLLFDTAYVGTFNETGGRGEVVALWATNGTVRWRHTAPASVSFSSPAISRGLLYVGVIGLYNTTTQITYDPPFGVLALDASTGTQAWFHATNAPVAASPLAYRSQVIVPAKDGFTYALNASTGAQLWRTDAAAGVSSPALVGSTVVVAGGSFAGGRVSALDATTGSVVWTYAPNGIVQSSVAAADGKVFFSTNVANGTIYSLNATSGRLQWSYMPSPHQYIFGSPVVADGRVFAPSDNGHIYSFQTVRPALPSVVNVTVPSQLGVGQTGDVTIKVSAPNGTWDDALLTVGVPVGLDVVSTSPASSLAAFPLRFDLGRVEFGRSETVTVTVRGNETGVPLNLVVSLQATAGEQVFGYSPSVPAILVTSQNPGPNPSPPWLAELAVAAVVAAAAVIAIILFMRRRKRGP